MAVVARFDIFLLNLDEHVSNDAKNTRPCVIVSPNEINDHLDSVIIAPISSGASDDYPTRLPVMILNAERSIVLDQLRTVDKQRLVKKIGELDAASRSGVLDRLQELFAE